MNQKEVLTKAITRIDKLRREHRVVDGDCYYSCPASEDYCSDDGGSDKCDCGAPSHNQEVDEIIAMIVETIKSTK